MTARPNAFVCHCPAQGLSATEINASCAVGRQVVCQYMPVFMKIQLASNMKVLLADSLSTNQTDTSGSSSGQFLVFLLFCMVAREGSRDTFTGLAPVAKCCFLPHDWEGPFLSRFKV